MLPMTRTGTDWGVPVPDDESGGVIYVWFDALLNYLTATGWLERGEEGYLDTWPPDLQLMGKDILPRFHATIWPAMLMALGVPLPVRLYGHGWFLVNQRKMSKSLGNVYAPLEVVQALGEASGCQRPFAVDAFRYYMLREMPTDSDTEFSLEGLETRYNGDLANDLGNLVHRTLSMMHRYFEGRVPEGVPCGGGARRCVAAGVEAGGGGVRSGGLPARAAAGLEPDRAYQSLL
jgi:methionyl-tRNA synthetase